MTLPEVIPLFPLPNVVFFPRMPLPLHVFEPRYRAMVRDAARGAHLIGMALLRGAWQQDYYGRPPIFATGTVGEMVHVEELPDGRYNIVLRGLREYTIVRELERQPYREAAVTWRAPDPAPLPAGVRDAVGALVRRYLALRGKEVGEAELLRGSVDDETFVNFLAQHLDVEPLDKQALLEAATLAERARRLADVLEFRLEELRLHPGGFPGRAH
ncbi:MAG TPA: LON peptidase substrate-binding domain-containing protein [Candidatus Limnocylindria bacterium]|jgi:Lon protease-like protein|nr:LON peptidase substrate-binding domain-containing protein [Candidatus Limnocylindria bacterium]